MSLNVNNELVRVVVARLDAELETYVSQVNDEVTDGFTIDSPQAVLPFVPPVSYLNAFPTFGVMDGTFTLEDDTGHGGTGRSFVSVVCFEQHPDQEVLSWRLRRYAVAVARTLLAGRNIDDEHAWGVQLRRIDPGPTLGNTDPKTFLSMVTVTIEVRSEQDFLA
jgi:hypothetical protein